LNLAADPTFTGRFELLGEVGRGATGIVYRARHKGLDRPVAIKVLRPGGSTARFAREARLLAKVRSPYVVAIHDVEVLSSGYPLLVLEWVEGTNLSRLIHEEEVLREARVLPWMRDTCEGMLDLAQHGVIHRDLKPSNLLIDAQGHARVADFGLARGPAPSDELSQSGVVMGTPLYMAPEQADDPHGVDTRADIYSFGATFYHVLTGKPPFTGQTALSILFKHKTEPLIPPRTIRPDLSLPTNRILERCLAKIPSDRFSSFAEILGELQSEAGASSRPTVRAAEPVGLLGTLPQPQSTTSRVRGVDRARRILELTSGMGVSHREHGEDQTAFWRERAETRQLLQSALGEIDKGQRRRQLHPLTQRLPTLLTHQERRAYEKRKAVHLELAAAYAALDDVILRDRHLNWACDCVVTQVLTSPEGPERAESERQRDELYQIIDRRESFQRP
jgi:serine/threonine protein kinase